MSAVGPLPDEKDGKINPPSKQASQPEQASQRTREQVRERGRENEEAKEGGREDVETYYHDDQGDDTAPPAAWLGFVDKAKQPRRLSCSATLGVGYSEGERVTRFSLEVIPHEFLGSRGCA